MSKADGLLREVIPEHLMLGRLAQSEQMREFFIQMWIQNPVLARQGGSKVQNLLLPLAHASVEETNCGPHLAEASKQTGLEPDQMQRGFSLISAIFLLVVVAALGTFAVTLSTTQQQGTALDVMGARAYQAARAGVQWGEYQALQGGGACAGATTLPALPGTLSAFTVIVNCTSGTYSDVGTVTGTVTVYNLVSTASEGAAPNYVERRVSVTIAQ